MGRLFLVQKVVVGRLVLVQKVVGRLVLVQEIVGLLVLVQKVVSVLEEIFLVATLLVAGLMRGGREVVINSLQASPSSV